MRGVRIQRRHQGWPCLNDPNSSVAVAVDPPRMALGQAKPALQIEIVLDLLELAFANEKPGAKADPHPRPLLMDRIIGLLEPMDQFLELLLAVRAGPGSGLNGRRDLLDVRDVASDRRLFGPNFVEAAVDAARQVAEVLRSEPPFFSSTFRWIDSRTSSTASAMRKPGGGRGPP